MKLTLRELFLLVVSAAMGCGWWVEHRRAQQLAGTVEVMEYDAALKAEAAQKNNQCFELLSTKLKELGYRWRFLQGHKEDGTSYIFLADD